MKRLLFSLPALLVFFSCNNTKNTDSTNDEQMNENSISTSEPIDFPIAYIDTDSLLRAYDFAVYLQEELMKKEEKSRTDFNVKAKNFQNQMAEFQRKLENNGFLSRERAENEQRNLQLKEQELQNLNTKLSNELVMEQSKLNQQLKDTITNYLEEYNSDGRYKLILSNNVGDNILYSVDGINITQTVITNLNSRYDASKE